MTTTSQFLRRGDYAYQQIRLGLLVGRWRAGEAISAYHLAEELTVSRTPIMEALKRLEVEGYLEIIPQVGCVVRSISPQQIREFFLVRAAIEGVAAELAARRISEEALGLLRSNLALAAEATSIGDVPRFQELNRSFHQQIVHAAGVPLLDVLALHVWQRREYEIGSQVYFRERLAKSLGEHRGLVALLAARDGAQARALAEAHIREAAELFAQIAE